MVDRRRTDSAPTRELLSYFDALHVSRFGERAVIQGGKDAKLIAGLATSHGAERVKELMAVFFQVRDPFVAQAGYTVGVFVSQAGKLIARYPKAQQRPSEDWWDECKRLHKGTCESRYQHGLRAL